MNLSYFHGDTKAHVYAPSNVKSIKFSSPDCAEWKRNQLLKRGIISCKIQI